MRYLPMVVLYHKEGDVIWGTSALCANPKKAL